MRDVPWRSSAGSAGCRPLTGLIWLFVYPLVIPLTLAQVALGKVLAGLAWAFRRASERFSIP